jgi:hypothetical protein
LGSSATTYGDPKNRDTNKQKKAVVFYWELYFTQAEREERETENLSFSEGAQSNGYFYPWIGSQNPNQISDSDWDSLYPFPHTKESPTAKAQNTMITSDYLCV